MKFYTYGHYRESDGRLFYIGKGTRSRAHATVGRNAHWASVVAKHGLKVEIFARWKTEQEAFEHEKFLISCFRDDLGFVLANKTDGGEGSSGLIFTPEARARHLEALKRVNSELTAEKRKKSAELAWSRPERRDVASQIAKEVASRPHVAEMKRLSTKVESKKRWSDPDYAKRASESMRGKKKTMSQAAIEARRANGAKSATPEASEKKRQATKALWDDPVYRQKVLAAREEARSKKRTQKFETNQE
jgi:hypothetical protein